MNDMIDQPTVDAALAMLPEGDSIHTFLNPAPAMMVGADWDRSEVESLIRSTTSLRFAGEVATSMGHGLVAWRDDHWVFIETKHTHDSA